MDDPGIKVQFPSEARYIFLFSKESRPALEPTKPPIELLPGVKQLYTESNHLPIATAKVKNEWIYTSTPPTRLHIVHRDTITFIRSHLNCLLMIAQRAVISILRTESPISIKFCLSYSRTYP